MSNYFHNERQKKKSTNKSNLNISDSNDFWNDCGLEEKNLQKIAQLNQLNNINSKNNLSNNYHTSLFNRTNIPNGSKTLNSKITKNENINNNYLAYKTTNPVANCKTQVKVERNRINSNLIENIKNNPSIKVLNNNSNKTLQTQTILNPNTNLNLNNFSSPNNKDTLNYQSGDKNSLSSYTSNYSAYDHSQFYTVNTITGNFNNSNMTLNSNYSNSNAFSKLDTPDRKSKRENFSHKNLEKFLNTKYNTESDKKNVYEMVENKIKAFNAVTQKNLNSKTDSYEDKHRFDLKCQNAIMKNQYLQNIYEERKRLESLKENKESSFKVKINNSKKSEEAAEKNSNKNTLTNNVSKNNPKLNTLTNQKEQLEKAKKQTQEINSISKTKIQINRQIEKKLEVIHEAPKITEKLTYTDKEPVRIEEYKHKISSKFNISNDEQDAKEKLELESGNGSAFVETNQHHDKFNVNPSNIDLINFEFDSDSELEMDNSHVKKNFDNRSND